MSKKESIGFGLSRRRLIGTMIGGGLVKATGGTSASTSVGSTDERLQISVRQQEVERGDLLTIDINVTEDLPDSVEQWVVDFGNGETRSSGDLLAILDSYSTRTPDALYGEIDHVYNQDGQYTVEIRAERRDNPTITDTTGTIDVGGTGDLVYAGYWATDFVGPFTDQTHDEGWTTDFIAPFDSQAHADGWTTDFVTPFDNKAHDEDWTTDFVAPFDDLIIDDGWSTDFIGPFDNEVHDEGWATDFVGAFEQAAHDESWRTDFVSSFDNRVHQDSWEEAFDSQTIQVHALSVSADNESEPTSIDVEADIANVTDEAGTRSIVLGIDELGAFEPGSFDYQLVEKRDVTLDAHESQTIQFKDVSTDQFTPSRYSCGVVTESDKLSEPVVIGNEELEVSDYADENGVVQTSGLRDAVSDWQAELIDSDLLVDIIQAWQTGST